MPDRISLYLGDFCHSLKTGSRSRTEWVSKGAIAVNSDGVIVASGLRRSVEPRFKKAKVIDFKDALLLPGFVDTHIHFPQMEMVGATGEDLLGWLNRHTFPEEARYRERKKAGPAAKLFFETLLSHGTTTASIYSSSFHATTDLLFAEAYRRGVRAIIGNMSMDRNAPEAILTDARDDIEKSQKLVDKWHSREGRLYYAVTPRFAASCTEGLLQRLGMFFKSRKGLYLQTHFSESSGELAQVRTLFPKAKDYLSVYERHGFLGPRTILAHAIHASPSEQARISTTKTKVSHCPSSNLFLGSGLFPLDDWRRQGVTVGLGTDVGAGTSFSLWATMSDAYKVQRLRGRMETAADLFYLATLGGAETLQWDHAIGNFEPGKQADFQVLSIGKHALLSRRWKNTPHDLESRLGALMTMADDRLVSRVYIGGRQVYRRI